MSSGRSSSHRILTNTVMPHGVKPVLDRTPHRATPSHLNQSSNSALKPSQALKDHRRLVQRGKAGLWINLTPERTIGRAHRDFKRRDCLCCSAVPVMMDAVLPWLWVGSLEAASDGAGLQARGITRIISVGCVPDPPPTPTPEEWLKYPEFLDMPHEPLCSIFAETTAFMQRAKEEGQRVLVHCRYGQSRSVSVVLAFLVADANAAPELPAATQGRLEAAISLVSAARPGICVNPGFLAQLHAVEFIGRGGFEFPELGLVQLMRRQWLVCPPRADGVAEGEEQVKRRRLVASQGKEEKEEREEDGNDDSLRCVQCSAPLCAASSRLRSPDSNYQQSLSSFLEKQLAKDSFWQGFSPSPAALIGATAVSRKGKDKGKGKGRGGGRGKVAEAGAGAEEEDGGTVVCPEEGSWLLASLSLLRPPPLQQGLQQERQCALRCPRCNCVCGKAIAGSLTLFGGFFFADRVQLNVTAASAAVSVSVSA